MMFADKLQEILARREAESSFSGVVTIRRGDAELFTGAYGYASRAWSIPNRADMRFRLASVGKMFTAVAALQLVERDLLALDTHVVELLSLANTTIPAEVTIEQLLTMTAGIADWFDETGDWETVWAQLSSQHPIYLLRSNADYLPLFAHKPPLAPVGVKHQYSNSSYILLALAIERVTGLSYFDYVRQHVFAPAGMTGADFVMLDEITPGVAEGYVPIKGDGDTISGWKKNIYLAAPGAAGDGGATASAEDLSRFLQALREPSGWNGGQALLSPAMTKTILEPKVSQGDELVRGYRWMYGYGNAFMIDDTGEVVRYGHTGEEDGVSCRLYHYLRQGLDVIILGNQSWCAGDLGWEIHDLILQSSPTM
jgi:CubicO group peptidase (beta-lactamase class C family)